VGQRKFREAVVSPSFNITRARTSTGAIIAQRVVKMLSNGAVKHTTGTSGRAIAGVALNGATGSGKGIAVQVFGFVDVEASTKAIALADWVRATSGAASTGSRLGGTVRTTTVNNQILGQAWTSAAAGAGKRVVTIFLNQIVNTVALI